ncbi:hypothetical protein C7N83_12015 [Neisseria iguanae]|uniref:Uncharacterized protein n=1 Tax=Neisseria iguanae TaxID=90242 RepID=A0A2P7TXQ0_9NEIS|nr:hypothetical protein C7N83_12015 [Neisseria iguanae]
MPYFAKRKRFKLFLSDIQAKTALFFCKNAKQVVPSRIVNFAFAIHIECNDYQFPYQCTGYQHFRFVFGFQWTFLVRTFKPPEFKRLKASDCLLVFSLQGFSPISLRRHSNSKTVIG